MLQNPIHLRLEKLESWQHVTFMAWPVRTYVSQLRDVLQANRVWRRPGFIVVSWT